MRSFVPLPRHHVEENALSPLTQLTKNIKIKTYIYSLPCYSLPIPHPRNLSMPHLFLQLKNPIHERLTRRRTTGNINIHRHNPITTPSHTI